MALELIVATVAGCEGKNMTYPRLPLRVSSNDLTVFVIGSFEALLSFRFKGVLSTLYGLPDALNEVDAVAFIFACFD